MAIPSDTGTAKRSATTDETTVPYTNGSAPKTRPAGSHVEPNTKPSPNSRKPGVEAWAMASAIEPSVITTTIADSAATRRNTKSAQFRSLPSRARTFERARSNEPAAETVRELDAIEELLASGVQTLQPRLHFTDHLRR